ncbi:MAG: DegQ family serine endoprotease [Desulfovibrio sp.]|uniref:DegQ family serine endoprotease n=1 Tax=Desulfovibrio sp. 7SRBS1 TaxID=3378064 RepID=UPI003B3F3068
MFQRKLAALTVFCLFLMATAVQAASLPDFTDLAAKAGKAVVNINTVKTVKTDQQLKNFFKYHQQSPQEGPFRDFFDQFEKYFNNRPQRPQKQRSLGSGFIISKDGYIVTNNHVIAGADEVSVNLQDDSKAIEAKIVGRDPDTDLALLKVDVKEDLPTLSFADSDQTKVGEWVLAIGNPFGLGHTVTAGIISAKGRVIHAGPFDNFLQTDASINPGNSGGPLINMDGKVVGINTAIVPAGQGIGFAVPSSMASNVIEQLRTKKKVDRGWLGVSIQDVDENIAKALDLKEVKGALIAGTMPDQPADKAGLKAQDVILKVNDKQIDNTNDLLRAIAGMPPGSKVDLTIWRNGRTKNFTVVLGQRDTTKLAQQGSVDEAPNQVEEELGLAMRPTTGEEAKALGMDKAAGLIVVDVQQDSIAGRSDIRPGDVIIQANQKPVNSMNALRKVLDSDAKKKGVLLLLIKRDGQNIIRTISLDKDK